MNKRYTLKNKKRFFTFVIIVLTIVFSIASFSISMGKSTDSFKIIEVVDGDSLWKIASANNSTNSDIRSLVYEIENVNKIEGAYLEPGMKLKIPMN